MINKVRKHITDNNLISETDKVLLAVSGGPDSVAMADILHKLGIRFGICHVNFQLRGDDSDGDEQYVLSLSETYKSPIHILRADTQAYAREHGQSIEMAAREIRYREFDRLMDTCGYTCTAVAHHQDDSIETFFLNLCRGAGIRGLAGIRVRNQRIVRPLLCLTRKEIEKYLSDNHLEYRTDKTNLESEYARNKIRNMIIPLLEEINPSVRASIAESIGYLGIAKEIYSDVMDRALSQAAQYGNRIPIELIQTFSQPECLTYELCSQYGFNKSQSRQILNSLQGESGKTFHSCTHTITKDRNHLIITERIAHSSTPGKTIDMPDQGTIRSGSHTLTAEVISPVEFRPSRNPNILYIDKDKLQAMGQPLQITEWRSGDTITMFGGKKKKVQDLLVDQKLSLPEKKQVEILRAGNTILWVIGIRTSNHCRIDSSTTSILKITAK